MLPAELQPIQDQFNQLLAAYQAGSLTYDDAIGTLRNLAAVDGAGNTWKLNHDGQWERTRPGAAPELCDPSNWVPVSVTSAPTPAWMNDGASDLLAPPGPGDFLNGSPDPMLPGIPGVVGVPGELDHSPLPGDIGPGGLPGEAKAPRQNLLADAEDEKGLLDKILPGGLGGKVAAFVAARKSTVIVAVIVVLAVVFFLTSGGGEDAGDSADPDPGGVPQITTPDTLPVDGETPAAPVGEPAGEPPAAAPGMPSSEDQQRVLGGLVSGDRDLVDAVIGGEPLKSSQAGLIAARFAGLEKAGFALTQGPAAPTGEGTAQSILTVTDTITGDVVAETTLSWKQAADGSGWILAAVPAVG